MCQSEAAAVGTKEIKAVTTTAQDQEDKWAILIMLQQVQFLQVVVWK